jgi:hypothetical protein
MSSQKYYDLLQDAPAKFEPIANLFSWSENYTWKDAPARVFLGLIGYMAEEYGEDNFEGMNVAFGYLELAQLGDALVAYSTFGQDAYDWVKALMDADQIPEDAHLYDENGEFI